MNVGNNKNFDNVSLNTNNSKNKDENRQASQIDKSVVLTNNITNNILRGNESLDESVALHEITRDQIPASGEGDQKTDKNKQSGLINIAKQASNKLSKLAIKRQNQPKTGSDNLTHTPKSAMISSTPRGEKSSAIPSDLSPSTPRNKFLSIITKTLSEQMKVSKIKSNESPIEDPSTSPIDEMSSPSSTQTKQKNVLSGEELSEMQAVIQHIKQEISPEKKQHFQDLVAVAGKYKKTFTEFQLDYLEKYLSKHPFDPKETNIEVKLPSNEEMSQYDEIHTVTIFRTEHRDICLLSTLPAGAYKRPYLCVDLNNSKELVTYGAKTEGVLSEEQFESLKKELGNEIDSLMRFNHSPHSLKIIDTINMTISYEKKTLDNDGKVKTEILEGQIAMPVTEKAKGTLDSLCLKLSENELVNFFDLWTLGIQAQENEDFLHADIKEGNVLLSNQNEPLIFDYGLSLSITAYKNNLNMGRIENLIRSNRMKEKTLDAEMAIMKASLTGENNNEISNQYRQLIKEKIQTENISKNLEKLLLSVKLKQENGELADNEEITNCILELQKDARSTQTLKIQTGSLLTDKIVLIKRKLEQANIDSLTKSIHINQIAKIEKILRSYMESNEKFLSKESLEKLIEIDSDLVKNIAILYNPRLNQHKEIIKALDVFINSLGSESDENREKIEILESIKNNLDNEFRLDLTETEYNKIKTISSNLLFEITRLSNKDKIDSGLLIYQVGSKAFMPFEMLNGISPEDFDNYDPRVFQSFALGKSLIGVGLKYLKQINKDSSLDRSLDRLVKKINTSLQLETPHQIISSPYPRDPSITNPKFKNIELSKEQIKTLMMDTSLTPLEKRIILGYGMANIDWKKTLTKSEYNSYIKLTS